MKAVFDCIKIESICTVVPERIVRFEDEIENYNFSKAQSMKLKATFDLQERRVVNDGVCASDLACDALKALLGHAPELRDQVGGIIYVSQSNDYLLPPTSNLIQARYGFSQEVYCVDISQGCAGFVIGLFQAAQLISTTVIRKVLVINADALSRKVSPRDRNSNPLIGDAASVTVVSRTDEMRESFFNIKMDGRDALALWIPAGGARMPSSLNTAELQMDSAGNFRSLNHLVMKGDSVFNFVQTAVPPLILETLAMAGRGAEEIDYFLFHQPNRFMLTKLAASLGLPMEKVPANVVRSFGNASGVTIPTAITHNYAEQLLKQSFACCLSGFGVGLTWAAAVLDLGPLSFCLLKEYEGERLSGTNG
jgi:3-oxoacyl-[acyl-carrier-protein] synthase-3